ncbi:MFS transporter [Petroclostridium sp. X23]|uniref:MFS transporter n=1 Tax=Petroclostridium sp. X23 TaxID=3045146 RepID=UPI0024AD8941|nr:MFS transporter [Petroclostridium sp. X23]WHH61312.1 MFS transporter [Petroclostridium sp. X23]
MIKRVLNHYNKDFLLFILCSMFIGIGMGIYDTTFNNFLDKTYDITAFMRGLTEFPREFPGFFVVLISFSVFHFLGDIRLAIFANIVAAVGFMGMGFFSPSYGVLMAWLFIQSSGVHIYLPLTSSIGMSLSDGKKDGSVLGTFQAITTAATVVGCSIIWLGFRYMNFSYQITFTIAAVAMACAAVGFMFMTRSVYQPRKTKVLLKRKYSLFYWLNILYGARKQVFMTFGPWVLIKIFNQDVEIFAILGIVGSMVGVFFKPMLGKLIDLLGEKLILAAEAVILVFVCIGYGFSEKMGLGSYGIYLAYVCFIIDQMLMGVSMARATYVKKIADEPGDISPTIAMGVSIDHAVAMTMPFIGGIVWTRFGYEYVFLCAAAIAVINFISVLRIKIPTQRPADVVENAA